jgi:hypothetical protein
MRPLAAAALFAVVVWAAPESARAKPPAAGEILRKAESVRNPELTYAVDFTIHGVARNPGASVRDAAYAMIASGKDRTVIVMKTPEPMFGSLVLMADGRSWMLLAKATRPWELSGAQMQNGDIATGDIARADFSKDYDATLAGEEAIDGESCWRLELVPRLPSAHFARVVYWAAKKGFLPRKLDHYGRTGSLLKTVRFGDYRKGALGLRPMTLGIESFGEWKEASTLTFTNLRRIDVRRIAFAPEGLIPLRDAVLAARGSEGNGDAPFERVLATLPPSAAPETKR